MQGTGYRVQGTGYRVQGIGYRVWGCGSWVAGSGFWVGAHLHAIRVDVVLAGLARQRVDAVVRRARVRGAVELRHR